MTIKFLHSIKNLPFAAAVKTSLRQGYGWTDFRADTLAGISLGIIALPLAMALAIASGVAPEYGIYTAIVAGAVIALTGGSKFNVSGPTAAFVVLLLPITSQYGLAGLLLATLMAGFIQLTMGYLKLGRLIQFIPAPVVLGFTAGIAVVIASLQLKDFFGLANLDASAHIFTKLFSFFTLLSEISLGDLAVGLTSLLVLVFWPRLRLPIPGHLPAILLATGLAIVGPLLLSGFEVVLLGDVFSWEVNGETGQGVPPVAPSFILPWEMAGANGKPLELSWDTFAALAPAAFTLALLGAIESLLCAVIGDSLTSTKHDPNAELVGQGLGNMIAPFFGGITATAALARTAANIKAGAKSPFSAVIHSITLLACLVLFASWLSFLPMAALAGLLLIVAWNMSEAKHFIRMLKTAPASDVLVLLTCFSLTVIFDMVLAVGTGIVLASLLFMGRMAKASEAKQPSRKELAQMEIPEEVAYLRLSGPLFFAASEKSLGRLSQVSFGFKAVFVDLSQVNSLDITAINVLARSIEELQRADITLVFIGLRAKLILKMRRAGLHKSSTLRYARSLKQAKNLWAKKQGLALDAGNN